MSALRLRQASGVPHLHREQTFALQHERHGTLRTSARARCEIERSRSALGATRQQAAFAAFERLFVDHAARKTALRKPGNATKPPAH